MSKSAAFLYSSSLYLIKLTPSLMTVFFLDPCFEVLTVQSILSSTLVPVGICEIIKVCLEYLGMHKTSLFTQQPPMHPESGRDSSSKEKLDYLVCIRQIDFLLSHQKGRKQFFFCKMHRTESLLTQPNYKHLWCFIYCKIK